MDILNASPLAAAVLAAAAVLLLSLGLLGRAGASDRARRLRERLDATQSGSGLPGDRTLGPDPAPGRTVGTWKEALHGLVQRLGGRVQSRDQGELQRLRTRLVMAGYRGPRAPQAFQGVKAGLAVVPAGLAWLAQTALAPDLPVQAVFLGVAGLASMGCYLPDLHLRRRAAWRRERLSDELPDVLDLLVVCVESGMGLDQAVHRVCEEVSGTCPVLSQELAQLNLELRAGRRRQDALRDLSRRVDLEDLNSLVTLLIQADAFGVSVARTLRVYADTLRTKRYQRAEEKAAKLPAKLLIPLVFCILPALLVTIMGPAGLHLMRVFAQVNK